MHVFHMTWFYSCLYTDFLQEYYDMNAFLFKSLR
jgi:hypothetical protein